MASTLQQCQKEVMIEKQSIKGTDVWFKVDPHPVERSNHDIIPTEYFTATYYLQEPQGIGTGETIKDEDGEPRLFESPVAALSYARKRIESSL